jgi:hypothetical protein
MDFALQPDPDFDRLRSDPEDYEDNYEYKMNCLARRTFFVHTVISLREIKAKLREI